MFYLYEIFCSESVNVEEEEVRKMLRESLDLRKKYLYREEVAPWEKLAVAESDTPSLKSDPFHFEPVPATTVRYFLLFEVPRRLPVARHCLHSFDGAK